MKRLHWNREQYLEIAPEEYWMLVNGKFSTRRCAVCDGTGFVWVNEDGEVESKPSSDESLQDGCYDCDGFGFSVIYDVSCLERYDL